MANWYHTSFTTDNEDILNLIKDGCVDFHYYEDDKWGHCELRYGMATLDMEAIAKVAEEQGASFRISAGEPINCISHIWEFKDGKEICLDRIQGEREF